MIPRSHRGDHEFESRPAHLFKIKKLFFHIIILQILFTLKKGIMVKCLFLQEDNLNYQGQQ